jgi:hypothetical protein
VKTTFLAPAYWIAIVWPPLPRTVVCIAVLTIAAGLGEDAVAGAKLILPVVVPSTRIWIGQASSTVYRGLLTSWSQVPGSGLETTIDPVGRDTNGARCTSAPSCSRSS